MPGTPSLSVRFDPGGVSLVVPAGRSLLEAALGAGLPLAHACGGQARCSTCRVVVLGGAGGLTPRTDAETALANRLGFCGEVRLACQTYPRAVPAHGSEPTVIRRAVVDRTDERFAEREASGARPPPASRSAVASLLFADLAGYTSFAADRPPYDVIHVLERYYHHTDAVVAAHGGRVIDYNGDEFVAVFEDLTPAHPGHAHPVRAVRAATDVLLELAKFNHYLRESFDAEFDVRIGVHVGSVVFGHLGSGTASREVVVGDNVNRAARIEQANKRLGTRLLVSGAIEAATRAYLDYGPPRSVEMRGIAGPQSVFELA